MDAYRWLGEMAIGHLVEGGILLIAVGTTQDLLAVGNILTRNPGLTSMDFEYHVCRYDTNKQHTFSVVEVWKPLLVFGKGTIRCKILFSDTYTVRQSDGIVKTHHPWQQPLKPWVHFLKHLSLERLIADPFAGSEWLGVAVKLLGEGRKYLGTEIDADHCLVARQGWRMPSGMSGSDSGFSSLRTRPAIR